MKEDSGKAMVMRLSGNRKCKKDEGRIHENIYEQ
jgi:hypothetical protein